MKHNQLPNNENRVFALDIGTRSVIGIVGHRQNDLFTIEAVAQVAHPRRAMIDGQIEDIEQVANVAGQVKKQLEDIVGFQLKNVAVAAAGRALKTRQSSAKISISGKPVTKQTVFELENQAVNEAHRMMDEDENSTRYFCVGHSVVRYEIDDYPFASILEHQGNVAKTEIIATFLPCEVVNSLKRCTDLLGLTITTLTLEPIAAIRAVIPQDIRLLNLALIDIGAGTSDIALSRDGTISGYTMATIAGDEITEAVIKKYLVDFETAEQMKKSISKSESVAYTDILGFSYTTAANELLECVQPSIDMLSEVVCERILKSNDDVSPAAVFLVGGGSMAPELAQTIAERLKLDSNRVAIGGNNFMGRVLSPETPLDGPEFATPIGIALIAADNRGNENLSVLINGRQIRLFLQQKTSVMDALLFAGYSYADLMGRNGRSLTFTFNSVRKVARGEIYTVAETFLNGKLASLQALIHNGDEIKLQPAACGKDAAATVSDYLKEEKLLNITLNNAPITAGLCVLVNGFLSFAGYSIQDLDEIKTMHVETLGELFQFTKTSFDTNALVNGKPEKEDYILEENDVLSSSKLETHLNSQNKIISSPNKEVTIFHQLNDENSGIFAKNDVQEKTDNNIGLKKSKREKPNTINSVNNKLVNQVRDKIPNNDFLPPSDLTSPKLNLSSGKTNESSENQANMAFQGEEKSGYINAENDANKLDGKGISSSLKLTLNGRVVVLPPKIDGSSHILLDLLPLLDIDPKNPQGAVHLKRNGQNTAYIENLQVDDVVEIGWEADFQK